MSFQKTNTELQEYPQVHTARWIQVGDQMTLELGLLHVHLTFKTIQRLVTQQLAKRLTDRYMPAAMIRSYQTTLHRLLVTVLALTFLTMVEQNLYQCLHTTHMLDI